MILAYESIVPEQTVVAVLCSPSQEGGETGLRFPKKGRF
jgi:hypothetical protein